MSSMSIMNPATMLPERWQDFQDRAITLAGRKVDLQVPPPAVEVAEDVNVEPEAVEVEDVIVEPEGPLRRSPRLARKPRKNYKQ